MKNDEKNVTSKNKLIKFQTTNNENTYYVSLKKVFKNDDGFIVAQSDMPFVKLSDINKMCRSIKTKQFLVHALKYKNRLGNPIGFDISLIKKFKNIKGQFGAKFMVKRLKNRTNFIKTKSIKSFKDFDKASDFRS